MKLQRSSSKDSLMRAVVDSVLHFANTKILGAGLPQKAQLPPPQDKKQENFEKEGFILQRQEHNQNTFLSKENDQISALERVRISPAVHNFSFKKHAQLRLDLDLNRKESNSLTEEFEQFNAMLQSQINVKDDKKIRRVVATKFLIENRKNSLGNSQQLNERHKFVKSQLCDEKIDDLESEINKNGRFGSNETAENENEIKSRNRSLQKIGVNINEAIKNKNCTINEKENPREVIRSQKNLLGQLLSSRPVTEQYSSARQISSGTNTERESRQNSFTDIGKSQQVSNPKHIEQSSGAIIKNKLQTVTDRTANILPFQIVKHTEQKPPNTPLQIFKQQLLTITQKDNFCVSLSHIITKNSQRSNVNSDSVLGSIQITYSTAVLQNLFELLVAIKNADQLPSFRDLDLMSAGSPVKWINDIFDQRWLWIPHSNYFLQKQVDKQMIKHLLNFAQKNSKDFKDKINLVDSEFKNQNMRLNVQADRVFVSLFEQESKDQIIKFASPQISLIFQKDKDEVNCDIFGFQYQQTADLGALQQFANNIYIQAQMLASNSAIKKGTCFYEQMVREYQAKERQKLRITQLSIAKAKSSQYGNLKPGLSGAAVSPKPVNEMKERLSNGKKKNSQNPKSQNSITAQSDFQFQQFKNKLRPTQQKVSPKGNKHLVKSPQKFSMVSSSLKLEELPSKKGDQNNLEDVIGDDQSFDESEGQISHDLSKIQETEPVMFRGDEPFIEHYQLQSSSQQNNDFSNMHGKARQSIVPNQIENFNKQFKNTNDGTFSVCITQITTNIPGESHLQYCQQPGMIYMNFDKDGEKKLPQKPINLSGVRPASTKKQPTNAAINLFKKAAQVKQNFGQAQRKSNNRTKQGSEEYQKKEQFLFAPQVLQDPEQQAFPDYAIDDQIEDASNYFSQSQQTTRNSRFPKQWKSDIDQTPPREKGKISPRKKSMVLIQEKKNILGISQSQDLSQGVVNKNRMDYLEHNVFQ